MRCLAVDDEPLALSVLREFCSRVPYCQLVATASNAVEAASVMQHEEFDLVFLDINMPHLSGVEFARITPRMPMVIFTTAYSDYALEGFEVNAVDYLLKPFPFDRFFKAVQRAQERYELKNATAQNPLAQTDEVVDYLMVRVDYSTVKVMIDDILIVEGLKDYVKIYTADRNYVTKSTMKNVEEKLPGDRFVRVHKSFIININKIEAYENNQIKIAGRSIPLGNQSRELFLEYVEKNRL